MRSGEHGKGEKTVGMLSGDLPRQDASPVVSDEMKLFGADGIREGENVGFMDFLKVGSVVMFPALACALAARVFFG